MTADVRKLQMKPRERDLVDGVPKDGCNCPLAITARRAGLENPFMSGTLLWGYLGKRQVFARMPHAAVRFALDFDAASEFGKPHSLPSDLKVPEPFEVELLDVVRLER